MTQDTQTPQQPQDETMTAIERDRFFGGVFPTRWLSGSRGKCYRWENSRVYEQATAEYVTHLEGALREAEAELAIVREELGYADLMARAVPLLEHDRDSFRSKAEVRGTSSCPLCGIDTPHAHHDEEIAKWVNAQSARFGLRALVYRFDDQILVETDEEIGYWDWEQRTHEASSLEDVFAELKQFATKLAATSRAKLTAAGA